MANQRGPDVREAILEEIREVQGRPHGATLQNNAVLDAVGRKLGTRNNPVLEQAILTEWSELFRTGLLAWGLNLSNPNPPFFHVTDRGNLAFQSLARDPANAAGYMRHLSSQAHLDPIALSYLKEGLDCYIAGLYKAGAVMVGASAERIVLNVRDVLVQRLNALARPIPRGISDWKIKTVSDGLRSFFDGHKTAFSRELRESFEASWPAFAQQIRAARNDAGHPESIDPVTSDTLHASLLVFPELAKVANELERWVANDLQ